MDMKKIGQYIRAQRKAAGLTQQQLADILGVSFQAVSKWENGDAMPDAGLLLDLADALHTSTDRLLSGGSVVKGDWKRMRVTDVIEGFSHMEAIGRCFGENSTFYTGMVEGVNRKMNIDLVSYLHDPKTRSMLVIEALIQGIMNGYDVDMEEVRAYIANPRTVALVEEYLDQSTGNRLMQFANGYRNARAIREGQILVVRKQNDTVEMFEYDLSEASAQVFLAEQKEPISELLCMRCDGQPDVPSQAIRAGLLAAFAENASAIVYLDGPDGLCKKTLSQLQ